MLTRKMNWLLAALVGLIFVTTSVYAADEEQRLLNSPSFIFVDLPGQHEIVNTSGKAVLRVWPQVTFTAGNVKSLTIEYDRIWVLMDKRYFSDYEVKTKFKGKLDINEVYWKDNEIVAYVVKKYYPTQKEHKITDIFDRNFLLNNM